MRVGLPQKRTNNELKTNTMQIYGNWEGTVAGWEWPCVRQGRQAESGQNRESVHVGQGRKFREFVILRLGCQQVMSEP